ncbi:MAG: cold shock domain-containing protein [Rhodospirillales bacterium]|nr:cold shock domain-containing protein [Rhodospirillales bacterium]MCB9997304.1 cold shock domain-containing protein [Rhodospirillales bacterium]
MDQAQKVKSAEQDDGRESVPVKARLKWFNGPKGFGFVNPVDRPDVDAFLHITTLQDIGIQAIGDGAVLLCDIEYGDKGAHVITVNQIIEEGVLPKGVSASISDSDENPGQMLEMKGIVKWYKNEDGFGFVIPADGMKDVFIHKSCLERHGVETIEAGQRMLMTFRNVPKGREVVSFTLLPDV